MAQPKPLEGDSAGAGLIRLSWCFGGVAVFVSADCVMLVGVVVVLAARRGKPRSVFVVWLKRFVANIF